MKAKYFTKFRKEAKHYEVNYRFGKECKYDQDSRVKIIFALSPTHAISKYCDKYKIPFHDPFNYILY